MPKPPKTPPPAPIRHRASEAPPLADAATPSPARASDARRIEPQRDDSLLVEAEVGPASLKVEVKHTPAGLLALGACVTSILLGAAAIVWVSTSPARRRI
ncbi:hypothetical protein [Brevundimonas sp. PAMC22021]|uniref:hypothetical protein n=1 Tax=Brevundimonas sp. PAMC22021 TaxID=2861285 RepID=UPI001C6371B9|nr:hypothetical protein [Brevundimonas sp. PAMC22021]QYF85808.1 hypothetical protein KY493_07965 [Brevundimonas sp. PAMC22021]